MSYRTSVLLLALSAGACGSSTPQTTPSPTIPSSTTPVVQTSTTLTIISGDANLPVSGAVVVVGGTQYTSRADGTLVVNQQYASGTQIQIDATGFFSRQTFARSPVDTRLALWPVSNVAGLNEQLTTELVYTPTGSNPGGVGTPTGSIALQRLDPSITQVGVSAGFAGLASSGSNAIAVAASRLTAATGGQVSFVANSTGGNAQITIVIGTPASTGQVSASTRATFNNLGYITGATITIADGSCLTSECDITAPRASGVSIVRTLVHEMGHVIGFNHSSGRSVMNGGCFPGCGGLDTRLEDFTDAERSLIRLMYQRRAGNRLPDNDRAVP